MFRANPIVSIARSGALAGVCLLVIAVGGETGLSVEAAATDFAFRSWDARDGFPQRLINDIQRTPNGYLWVATRVGLVRFDGARFKVFDAQTTPTLRTNWISCLLAESGGGLWVGTDDGLFRFLPGATDTPEVVEAGNHLGVRSLVRGEKAVVWCLSSSNDIVRVVDGKVAGTFRGPGGLAVRAIAANTTGQLVAACADSLYVVSAEGLRSWPGQSPMGAPINAMCPRRHGGFWIAAGRQVTSVWPAGEAAESQTGGTPRGSPPAQITVLIEDQDGRLWAGTRTGGIYCGEPGGRWRQITARRSRSFGGITCLYEDGEGLFWAGTSAGILREIKPRLVTVWSLPTTVREHIPQTVCATRDGAVWIGTDGAGAYRCRDGAFTHFGAEEGLNSATVMAILEDRQTNVWFGTYNGLFRLENGRLHAELTSELAGQAVPALFQDSGGDLWLGTAGAVIRKRNEQVKVFELGEDFREHEVRALAEGPPGSIWIGTYGGGLFCLEDERITHDDRFPRPALTALHCDGENTLWIGTLNNGIYRLRGNTLGHWRTKEGLPGNTVYAILEDAAGMLWLSSNAGVVGLSKQELAAYDPDSGTPAATIQLATSDVESWSAGSGQPSAGKGPDGRLWFPVGHGVVSFASAAVTRSRPELPVMIEEVLADGIERRVGSGESIRVLSGVRRLEMRYTIADLDAPGLLRFRYKLEGADDQWVEAGSKRAATYEYLPPGSYRFRVIASGSQGAWSELATPLEVEIVPRLWERRWFQALCAVAILTAVALVARGVERAKVRRKMERLELQQSMENERRRIARDLHDDLGSGLTEIMLLGEVARRDGASAAETQEQIEAITSKTRRLAAAMDEVVWTVNPRNDSVPGFASYVADYAREYFGAATARCRVDLEEGLPAAPLTAQTRHQLFLAVKEAMNNVAKHAEATEVWLRIHCANNGLEVVVEDNGRGFDAASIGNAGNGLDNMRARLRTAGGTADISSRPGKGTRVYFSLPLAPAGNA